MARVCDIDGCGKPQVGLGLCAMHRARLRRNGDALVSQRLDRDPATKLRQITELDPYTGCVEVIPRYRQKYGYGFVSVNGVHQLLHRVAYELAYDKPPPGFVVMHMCDNPPCVNPMHLMLGTHADNKADSHRKGRTPRGEAAGQSKLTEAQVREIVDAFAEGERTSVLARRYGVTESTISHIRCGRTWTHVLDKEFA